MTVKLLWHYMFTYYLSEHLALTCQILLGSLDIFNLSQFRELHWKKFISVCITRTCWSLKATSQCHDFHRCSSAMAEKSQIAVFVPYPRGLFPISGPQ